MGDFLINTLKLAVAVLLIPVLMAASKYFYQHFSYYPSNYQDFFFWGVLIFIFIFVFFYQFWGLYEFGQKISGVLFKALTPLDGILSAMFPLYTVLLLVSCWVFKHFLNVDYSLYFIFFAGFMLMMHIVLTAQELQEQSKSPFHPTYLSMMSISYLANMMIALLLLDLVVEKFTFFKFLQCVGIEAKDTYLFVIHNLIK